MGKGILYSPPVPPPPQDDASGSEQDPVPPAGLGFTRLVNQRPLPKSRGAGGRKGGPESCWWREASNEAGRPGTRWCCSGASWGACKRLCPPRPRTTRLWGSGSREEGLGHRGGRDEGILALGAVTGPMAPWVTAAPFEEDEAAAVARRYLHSQELRGTEEDMPP